MLLRYFGDHVTIYTYIKSFCHTPKNSTLSVITCQFKMLPHGLIKMIIYYYSVCI